jgi:putative peptidoglycan lipid II flippase
MLGLIALSTPVVRLLFEHGMFGVSDTDGTAHALKWLALGLPAQVLIKALSAAFFARGDTATPLWATLKGFAVAIALAIVLGWLFGTQGIAASIALGAWSNAFALIRHGGTTFGFAIDASARRRLPRIIAASGAMGALLWLSAPIVPAAGGDTHGFVYPLLLGALILGGIAIYGLFLALLGVIRWDEAVRTLRETAPSRLRD